MSFLEKRSVIENSVVYAAIVVYEPDVDLLSKLLAALTLQIEAALLIANDGAPWSFSLPEKVTLVVQDKNLGLGAAYNLAAHWAREHGATHLLLLDQDSVPAPGMVAALIAAFKRFAQIAAVGPLWRDSRTSEDGFFIRFTRWGTLKFKPAAGQIVPVDFLISSGSLISLNALAEIGPFDEKLFIEHVDTDFALRARARGYRLCGVADARLDHAFGEATLIASPLGFRRSFFLYPPERNYYFLRNSIILWRRPYAPRVWVWQDVCRKALMMLFYALFVPPRWERLKKMARAIREAFHFDKA